MGPYGRETSNCNSSYDFLSINFFLNVHRESPCKSCLYEICNFKFNLFYFLLNILVGKKIANILEMTSCRTNPGERKGVNLGLRGNCNMYLG